MFCSPRDACRVRRSIERFELSLTSLHPPRSPQASNAAADWAQKRKQALERATELRAQRKAAERASVQQVAEPVRGLESDPLPPPKQDASSDQTWWAGGNDGSAAGFGDAGRRQAGHEARQRRQWGEPSTLNPLSFGANGSGTTKENRDPGTPPRGADAPSGRLMPWEREMLVKQAEQEATAQGLPPTPSNEAIARVFGEYGEARDGDDPDVWGPPRPSPGKGPNLNRSRASPSTQRPASAAPRSPGAPTRLAASVAAGPRAQRSRNPEHDARDAARTKRGASDASLCDPSASGVTEAERGITRAVCRESIRPTPPARGLRCARASSSASDASDASDARGASSACVATESAGSEYLSSAGLL